MDIRRLRYFIAVADSLSFSRAAEVLGMTQPPLSQRIKELETELKAELLVRGRRGLAITPCGKRLLELARPLVEEFDHITRRHDTSQPTTAVEGAVEGIAAGHNILGAEPYPGFLAAHASPHVELRHTLVS